MKVKIAMGAARWVVTIAAVAIGAGTLLALNITPSFAPYQSRESLADPSEMDNAPFIALPEAQTQREAGPSYYEMEDDHSDSDLRGNAEDRGFVLVFPRWMDDKDGLMARGQRVWREWIDPEEPSDYHDHHPDAPRQHYGYDDGYDATVERYQPQRPYRPRVEESPRYGREDRLTEETQSAVAATPRALVERQPRIQARPTPAPASAPAQPPADAAAIAAARAREAARDVYAAQAAGE